MAAARRETEGDGESHDWQLGRGGGSWRLMHSGKLHVDQKRPKHWNNAGMGATTKHFCHEEARYVLHGNEPSARRTTDQQERPGPKGYRRSRLT